MKILKVAPNIAEKVKISKRIPSPYVEQLTQAKGVMENYLKDKSFNVHIEPVSSVFGKDAEDYIEIRGYNNKSLSVYHVKKESDSPFLRLIYKTLENFTKDCIG